MADRLVKFQSLVVALFGLLFLRLVHLQIIRGGYYLDLAEQNRLRVISEPAPRGLIVDRQEKVLAANQTLFRAAIIPQELEDLPGLLSHVAGLVKRSPEALRREYLKGRTLAFVPVTIVSRIPKETALRLEEESWQYPGLFIQAEPTRRYPQGAVAAQLLGYLSQPTAEELPLLKQYGVRPKQLVGRSGLEQLLDDALRGKSGGTVVEVNHRGRQVRLVGFREPVQGKRVQLTIDSGLQSLIEQTFDGVPGAAVVLNPQSGEVLAMASSPTFAPEAFATLDSDTVRAYLADPQTPLLNRATQSSYQPGSIIKLVTASAGLQAHVIDANTIFTCEGSMTIGDRVIHCWNRDGHGPVNLTLGLMQSCNVFFMHVGRAVKRDRLLLQLKQAGLGSKTGWMASEQAGHLPTRRLTEGEVALLAIGQGEILLTPLQAAAMAGIFASRGEVVQPWVIREVGGRPWQAAIGRRRVPWPAEVIETVRRAMIETVRSPEATAHRAFSPAVAIAGKTGTAQTHKAGRTHGWFVGFCPVENPKLALAVVAEYGGSGGDLPAEVARTACEYVAVTQ